MLLKPFKIISTLFWSLFIAVTVISIGLGAAFPSLNLIANPFVCPAGKMTLETQDFTTSPTEGGTVLTWYCVNSQTGDRVELGIFPMVIYTGIIYGLILFFLVVLWMWLNLQRKSRKLDRLAEAPMPSKEPNAQGFVDYISIDAARRIKELNALRDSNTITEAEYQKKRADIIQHL